MCNKELYEYAQKDNFNEFLIAIDEIWISLTEQCNLNCSYCCVTRENSKMSLDTGKKTIDLILKNGTNPKNINFFGGEPLLCFEVLKELTIYAQQKAKEKNIEIKLAIFTNATILNQEKKDFLFENNFKIFVSLSGSKKSHDKFRKDFSGKGSFDKIITNLNRFTKEEKNKLVISQIIHPKNVNTIFDDFLFLIKNGFSNIYICEVDGVKWEANEFQILKEQYIKILKYVIQQIKLSNFIYLFFPTKLLNQTQTKSEIFYSCNGSENCPLEFKLKVFSNGDISTSIFNLNEKINKEFYIGNITKGLNEKYLNCTFLANSQKCTKCVEELNEKDRRYDYYFKTLKKINKKNALIAKNINLLLCDGNINYTFVKYLFKKSKTNEEFAKYNKEGQKLSWGT